MRAWHNASAWCWLLISAVVNETCASEAVKKCDVSAHVQAWGESRIPMLVSEFRPTYNSASAPYKLKKLDQALKRRGCNRSVVLKP